MRTREMTDEQRIQMMATYATVLLPYAGMNRGEFMRLASDSDDLPALGIGKALELVGEAAYHISEEGRADYSDIDFEYWEQWRHELTHEYPSIDFLDVWDAVWKHIPDLHRTLENYGYTARNP